MGRASAASAARTARAVLWFHPVPTRPACWRSSFEARKPSFHFLGTGREFLVILSDQVDRVYGIALKPALDLVLIGVDPKSCTEVIRTEAGDVSVPFGPPVAAQSKWMVRGAVHILNPQNALSFGNRPLFDQEGIDRK